MSVDLRSPVLPSDIWCGEAYGRREVETGFRTWIAFDAGLREGVASFAIFSHGFRPSGTEWVSGAREFLWPPCATPHDVPDRGDRLLDLVLDGDYLVAAYQQAYGIDLTDPGLDMHWHRFVALLRGLPGDTVLAEAMRMRGWRDDRRSMAEVNKSLRSQWSLPARDDARTLSWQQQTFGPVAERARR